MQGGKRKVLIIIFPVGLKAMNLSPGTQGVRTYQIFTFSFHNRVNLTAVKEQRVMCSGFTFAKLTGALSREDRTNETAKCLTYAPGPCHVHVMVSWGQEMNG